MAKRTENRRVLLDFYPSEAQLVDKLLTDYLHIPSHATVFEPCCGDGAISNYLKLHGIQCTTNDLDTFRTADFHYDCSIPNAWSSFGTFDWVVTNPPYSLADEIVPLCWEHCDEGMAMLLRLSWLEPCKTRREFLKSTSRFLSDLIVLNPRPKFRSDTNGTDSITSAWFVWKKWKDARTDTKISFCTDWR